MLTQLIFKSSSVWQKLHVNAEMLNIHPQGQAERLQTAHLPLLTEVVFATWEKSMCPKPNVRDCISCRLSRSGTYHLVPAPLPRSLTQAFFLEVCYWNNVLPSNRCIFLVDNLPATPHLSWQHKHTPIASSAQCLRRLRGSGWHVLYIPASQRGTQRREQRCATGTVCVTTAERRHKETTCPRRVSNTTAWRKTTKPSRLSLWTRAVPSVTGRALTMPGHISTVFSLQLFCPESVCVEPSSQEAAWLGAAGLSCARAHLPGSVPSRQLAGNMPQGTLMLWCG